MTDLAVLLRHAQLHNHNVHHAAKGATSKQDHEMAGEFYNELEEHYDECVEIAIGLGLPINLTQVALTAAKDLPNISSNEQGFEYSQQCEEEIREMVKDLVPTVPDGAQNFLQDLAQSSLQRSYHLTQRLA